MDFIEFAKLVRLYLVEKGLDEEKDAKRAAKLVKAVNYYEEQGFLD